MSRQELIKDITEKLKREITGNGKNPRCYRSLSAYRFAGGLESLLLEEGFFKFGNKFEYECGGKKYFPLIGDFRWTESYPSLMLRKAEEYLKTLPE